MPNNNPATNIFESIPEDLAQECFTTLAKAQSVKIERIVSKGHASPSGDWYDQADNEWLIVIEGQAILSFVSQSDIHLGVGDYLNIPARKKHRVKWTPSDVETIWLAVHYR